MIQNYKGRGNAKLFKERMERRKMEKDNGLEWKGMEWKRDSIGRKRKNVDYVGEKRKHGYIAGM